MTTADSSATSDALTWGSRRAKLTLTACILGSGLAFLDSSVVAVASPRIEADLGGGLPTLQWVTNGYLLTLGALVLVGGALGDLLGKKRIFIIGIIAFGISSAMCGLAPSAELLVLARMIQGVAAALMVPTSLAILNSTFTSGDRAKAIGAWSGLAGVFTAIGPFIGGLLVDTSPSGWRWVFLINIPLVVGAVVIARIAVPSHPGTRTSAPIMSQVDILGGVLAVLGLGLLLGPLIEIERLSAWGVAALMSCGAALLVTLGFVERHRAVTRKPPPMINLDLFTLRTFSVANIVTVVVYGSLSVAFFLVTIALQQGIGYSAVAAGAAGVPVTIVLAAFSSKAGGLLGKIGARPMLTIGPMIMAVGMVLLASIQPGQSYWMLVFPGFVVFAIGLVFVVAPVTATALSDVGPAESGTASGINNAVARIGGLVAIILIPLAGGLAASQADALGTGEEILAGYRTSMLIAAGVCVVGALLSLIAFRSEDGRARIPTA